MISPTREKIVNEGLERYEKWKRLSGKLAGMMSMYGDLKVPHVPTTGWSEDCSGWCRDETLRTIVAAIAIDRTTSGLTRRPIVSEYDEVVITDFFIGTCCEQARLNLCKYRNANCNTFIENGYATDWTAFEYGKTARVIRLGGEDMSEQDLANVVTVCCRVEPLTMQVDRSYGNAYFLKPWIKDEYDEESMLALKSVITSQLIAQKKGKRSEKLSTIL